MGKEYNKEFKLSVVDLVLRKKLSCAQASQDLGIGLSTLQALGKGCRNLWSKPNLLTITGVIQH